jgi:predicted RNA methylase
MKIELDKYYTPVEKSIELIEFTFDFIGRDKIDTIIEPSAGDGSFSNYLFDKYSNKFKIHAFDIKPEEGRIKEQDFLKLSNFRYNDKCLIIGNPPFGKANKATTINFFNKSYTLSRYIAYILPINYYYKDDKELIYKEDLDIMKYSERDVHCCFNIYDKNNNVKKFEYKLPFDIKNDTSNITHYDFKIKRIGEYIGRIIKDDENIKSFYYIVFNKNNSEELKSKVKYVFENYNWLNKKFVSFPYIGINYITEILLQEIPELKKESSIFKF